MTLANNNQASFVPLQKLTFLGDILFELDLFRKIAVSHSGFRRVFAPLAPLLAQSDFVVANLETPIAGEKAGFTSRFYSFNTPSELLDALADLPIHLLTTANNHCLDRGLDGLLRTLDELDKRGLHHTGTFRDETECHHPCLVHLNNTTIAVEASTATINKDSLRKYGKDLQPFHVSTLANPFLMAHSSESSIPFYRLRCLLGDCISPHWTLLLKQRLGLSPRPWSDENRPKAIYECQLERLSHRLESNRQKADISVVLPHIGGQFNSAPGPFSEMLCKRILYAGADAVVATHPHVIQPVEFLPEQEQASCSKKLGKKICAYSLGNVTFSAQSPTAAPDSLPEFGLAFHMYLRSGTIDHISYSLLKFDDATSATWPVDTLHERLSAPDRDILTKQVQFLLNHIASRLPSYLPEAELPNPVIQKEYVFP